MKNYAAARKAVPAGAMQGPFAAQKTAVFRHLAAARHLSCAGWRLPAVGQAGTPGTFIRRFNPRRSLVCRGGQMVGQGHSRPAFGQ